MKFSLAVLRVTGLTPRQWFEFLRYALPFKFVFD